MTKLLTLKAFFKRIPAQTYLLILGAIIANFGVALLAPAGISLIVAGLTLVAIALEVESEKGRR